MTDFDEILHWWPVLVRPESVMLFIRDHKNLVITYWWSKVLKVQNLWHNLLEAVKFKGLL
jgi:hypothetical protein